MDKNKDKIEEVQTDDITSADTEKKDIKKKIIIISLIVASVVIIGLISWLVVTAIDKGKEVVDGISDSMNNIAENIPSLESDITLESKTTTELETTTEQPTTEEHTTEESTTAIKEIETIDPNTDPFTAVVAGSYTDEEYEYYVKIRTYENGAKRYVYHIDSENKDYEFSKIEEMPEAVAVDIYEKMIADGLIGEIEVTKPVEPTTAPSISNKVTIEDMLDMDKNAALTGEYKKDNVIYASHMILPKIMPVKNEWIEKNYGTQFEFNGIKFFLNKEQQYYYYEQLYGDIHYMTSTSTSIKGYYIKNYYSYRLADYLGFYGTDYALYMNEEALDDGIWELNQSLGREDKMTVDKPYNNNLAYLKQLGWVEVAKEDGITKDWSLESPEGIPARISSSGHISIWIKYEGDEREKTYEFTIEEYNDFVKNKNWKVSTRSGSRGLEGTDPSKWDKYIRKYLVISE